MLKNVPRIKVSYRGLGMIQTMSFRRFRRMAAAPGSFGLWQRSHLRYYGSDSLHAIEESIIESAQGH
jgi:hypothetical protein